MIYTDTELLMILYVIYFTHLLLINIYLYNTVQYDTILQCIDV